MRKLLALAAGTLVAAPLFAQTATRFPVSETTAGRILAPELISSLDLGLATEQSFELPQQLVDDIARIDASIAGEMHTLELWPHSVRADNFQLLVQMEDGSYESVEPAPSVTVRGRIVGMDESYVAGQIVDGSLTASVILGHNLPVWGIQPMRDVDASAPARSHVVYDSGDRLPVNATCGTQNILTGESTSSATGSFSGGPETLVTDIAIDADVQFYNLNGSSVSNTQQDIENVMNGVDARYTADVGISYNITTIMVRTSEPDPFTTSNSSALLNEFQNHWNQQQQSIIRDVAHLFTGRNLSGSTIGVAYLNTICNKSQGYGLSQSRFSNNFTSRVALTAHELGHNWSAQHCNGSSGCKIMCSGLGGCGGTSSFGPNASNQINNKKNSVGCLVSSIPPDQPTITSINPTSVTAISNAIVTLTGTEFEQLQKVTVGSVEVPANALSLINGKVQFSAPDPTTLGDVNVTITNVSGTSNSVTLSYSASEPPVVSVPAFGFNGQPIVWDLAGDALDTGYLLVSLDNQTFDFSGDTLLLNSFILAIEQLDEAGLATVQFDLPASAAGLNIRSQHVVFNGSGYDGASLIKATLIF